MRAEISSTVEPTPVILPTVTELEAVYAAQVCSLEQLLTGSERMVAANARLRGMLGEVHLWRDDEAREGMRVDIRGEASWTFQGVDGTQKPPL